ncbi:MAG: hypothetical protein PHQ72_14330 [Hespellia sp.]|nr:hypothetical protein [Hespellia sp.]
MNNIDVAAQLKSLIALLITGFFSIITDFAFAFIALFAGFTFNFLCGMAADIAVEKGFDMVKAKEGVKLFGFYVVVVFVVFLITYFKPDLPEILIVYFTLIVSYFYFTNAFKNATIIFPKDKAIRFIYELLSTEVFFNLKRHLGLMFKNNRGHEDEEN